MRWWRSGAAPFKWMCLVHCVALEPTCFTHNIYVSRSASQYRTYPRQARPLLGGARCNTHLLRSWARASPASGGVGGGPVGTRRPCHTCWDRSSM
ncbi:hypothetical protein PF010_g2555 [Phytophthora fragariae]|uniref:Secreted protein n=1 Tax=Phytophthora fragariae TaxID=53985 RepID=A0A6A3MHS8_9STRA|nr:hypothetical protein PF011_g1875 [Phytophthora fragariae]KAE9134132.1 hypothetical protein PF010_g2555 [Phytophthora fragariae]KAE9252675.1 hypothetical protein PF004_g1860 [Phytophthora fragariae]